MPIPVLLALVGSDEPEIVVRLASMDQSLSVTRRCADVTELLAAAEAGMGRVAVVSADLPRIDRGVIDRLARAGVAVVAIADETDATRMRDFGAQAVLPLESIDEIVPICLALSDKRSEDKRPERGPEIASVPDAAGKIITVWGTSGAPGRTTIAVELAFHLANIRKHAGGKGVLLVDADTHSASVAARLGLLDDTPGLAAACREASKGPLTPEGLMAHAQALGGGLSALTGIARPSRWPEISAPPLTAVLQAARAAADMVVIDCAHSIEHDELLTYDTRAPQRNAATITARQAADVLLVVGQAGPDGIARLVRTLEEQKTSDELQTQEIRVVVKRGLPGVCGPRPDRAIRHALLRYAGLGQVTLLPEDAGFDAANLSGLSLSESRPKSRASSALAALAAEIHEDLASTAITQRPRPPIGRTRRARRAG
jgi:MinD-like ATPase involved in chromosome partitioning or flagellar assembly